MTTHEDFHLSTIPDKYYNERPPLGNINPVHSTAYKMQLKLKGNEIHASIPNKHK
jgi:hypothetical protein